MALSQTYDVAVVGAGVVAASGNGVGLSLAEFEALSDVDREARVVIAARSLRAAGADIVVETVADLGLVVDEIGHRITNGERPPIS